MGKEPTDMKTYKEINDKLSEQQKESLITEAVRGIDLDATGIYESVDELEPLIAGDGSDSGIHGRLDTLHADFTQLGLDLDAMQTAIVGAINSAKDAIVAAINNQ